MDRVSFTGINNFHIFRKSYKQFGTYLPPSGAQNPDLQFALRYGEKQYNELILHCDLTDDISGNDFTKYLYALSKSYNKSKYQYMDFNKPNHVCIHLKRFDVEDDIGHACESWFKINGQDIILNRREVLALYTFMAEITRKLANVRGMSQNIVKCLRFMNKSVEKSAVDFIENM